MSELLEEELLSEEELRDMWESLPKADNGASIDLAGFVVFARKVTDLTIFDSPLLSHFFSLFFCSSCSVCLSFVFSITVILCHVLSLFRSLSSPFLKFPPASESVCSPGVRLSRVENDHGLPIDDESMYVSK